MASVLDGTVPLQRASISGGVAGQMNYQTMKFGTKFRLSGFGTKHPVPIEDAFDHYFGTTQSIMADLTKTFKDYFAFVKSSRKEDMVHQKRGGLWGTIRGFAPHFFDFKVWKKITGQAADPQIAALHQIRDFLINRFSQKGELDTNKRLYGRDPKDMFLAIFDQWGFERRRLAAKGEEKAGPFATIYRFMKEAISEGKQESDNDLKFKYGNRAWNKERGKSIEKKKDGFWDKMMKSGVGKAFMGFGSVASAKQMKSALPVVISEDISTATKKEAALLEETKNAQVQETKETKKLGKEQGKSSSLQQMFKKLFMLGIFGSVLGFALKGIFGRNGVIGNSLSWLFSKMGPLGEVLDKVFGKDGFIGKAIGGFFDKNGLLAGLATALFVGYIPGLIAKAMGGLFSAMIGTIQKIGNAYSASGGVGGALDRMNLGGGGKIGKGGIGRTAKRAGLKLFGKGGVKTAGKFAGGALGAAAGGALFAAEMGIDIFKKGGALSKLSKGDIGGSVSTALIGESDFTDKSSKEVLGAALGQGLKYGGLGATIGSIVPGVGTAIGGAVGAAVGIGITGLKTLFDKGYITYFKKLLRKNMAGAALGATLGSIIPGAGTVLGALGGAYMQNKLKSKDFSFLGNIAKSLQDVFFDLQSKISVAVKSMWIELRETPKRIWLALKNMWNKKDEMLKFVDDFVWDIKDSIRQFFMDFGTNIKIMVGTAWVKLKNIAREQKDVVAFEGKGSSAKSISDLMSLEQKYSGGVSRSSVNKQLIADYEMLKRNEGDLKDKNVLAKLEKAISEYTEYQKDLEKKEGGWTLLLNAMNLAADGIVTLIDVTKTKPVAQQASKTSNSQTSKPQVKNEGKM
jgi:hypothetical protein